MLFLRRPLLLACVRAERWAERRGASVLVVGQISCRGIYMISVEAPLPFRRVIPIRVASPQARTRSPDMHMLL